VRQILAFKQRAILSLTLAGHMSPLPLLPPILLPLPHLAPSSHLLRLLLLLACSSSLFRVQAWPRDGSGCSCAPLLDLCSQLQAARLSGSPVFAAQITALGAGLSRDVRSTVTRVFSTAMPSELNVTAAGADDPCSYRPALGIIHVIGLPSCGELSPYQPISTLSMERLRFIETMSSTSIGWTCDHNMSVYSAGYTLMATSACVIAAVCALVWRGAAAAAYVTLDESHEMSRSADGPPPPPASAAPHPASFNGLPAFCRGSSSGNKPLLMLSRALNTAAAAMCLSQILVYRQVLVEALQGDIAVYRYSMGVVTTGAIIVGCFNLLYVAATLPHAMAPVRQKVLAKQASFSLLTIVVIVCAKISLGITYT
jgi:hypothetical protein